MWNLTSTTAVPLYISAETPVPLYQNTSSVIDVTALDSAKRVIYSHALAIRILQPSSLLGDAAYNLSISFEDSPVIPRVLHSIIELDTSSPVLYNRYETFQNTNSAQAVLLYEQSTVPALTIRVGIVGDITKRRLLNLANLDSCSRITEQVQGLHRDVSVDYLQSQKSFNLVNLYFNLTPTAPSIFDYSVVTTKKLLLEREEAATTEWLRYNNKLYSKVFTWEDLSKPATFLHTPTKLVIAHDY